MALGDPGSLGPNGPLVLSPVIPEPWVPCPACGSYAGWGLLPNVSVQVERDRVPGAPGNGLHPSVGNHDLSLLPPMPPSVCHACRYSHCDSIPGLKRREQQSGNPSSQYGHAAMFRCPISIVHVPVPVPAPCPHLRSIIGHVAGWTRPYSRQCRTEATLTALQGAMLSCWRLRALRAGLLGLFTHSSIYGTHSFNHSITHSGPSGQGSMQGAYHISRQPRQCRRVWPMWAGRQTHVHAGHAVPHTERHDHSQPLQPQFHATRKAWSRADQRYIHAARLPCHAMPLLSSRLVW